MCERYIDWLHPVHTPTWADSEVYAFDQELNLQPFGPWFDAH